MSYSAFQGNNVADGSRTPSQNYETRYATALKLFSGEVFNAFNDATIFKGLVRNYSLRGGKSKQFLLTGKLGAGYHTPGTAIGPDAGLKSNEKTIVMDQLLYSSQFVYDLDEILSQWSARSEISKQIGEALALHYDDRIARVLAKGATESSVVTGEPGGFQVNIGAGNTNDAQALVDGFFEAAAVLDERSAPQDGRCAVLSPRQYYSLISSVDTNILNREIGNTQGDMNSARVSTASLASASISPTFWLTSTARMLLLTLPSLAKRTTTWWITPPWPVSSSTVKLLALLRLSAPALKPLPVTTTSSIRVT